MSIFIDFRPQEFGQLTRNLEDLSIFCSQETEFPIGMASTECACGCLLVCSAKENTVIMMYNFDNVLVFLGTSME